MTTCTDCKFITQQPPYGNVCTLFRQNIVNNESVDKCTAKIVKEESPPKEEICQPS